VAVASPGSAVASPTWHKTRRWERWHLIQGKAETPPSTPGTTPAVGGDGSWTRMLSAVRRILRDTLSALRASSGAALTGIPPAPAHFMMITSAGFEAHAAKLMDPETTPKARRLLASEVRDSVKECSAARTNVVFTNSYVDNNSSLISE
jgi:hypothetical protein